MEECHTSTTHQEETRRSVTITEEYHSSMCLCTEVRQGCVLSPLLFNCVMDMILKEVTEMLRGGLNIEYIPAG